MVVIVSCRSHFQNAPVSFHREDPVAYTLVLGGMHLFGTHGNLDGRRIYSVDLFKVAQRGE